MIERQSQPQSQSNLTPVPIGRSQDTHIQPGNWDELKERANFASRAQIIDFCVELSLHIPGNIIEFGVANGDSTRAIRKSLLRHSRSWLWTNPRKQIFACDSFEGLREKFENAEVGTFACEPPKIPSVRIVKGYFEDSLTPELAEEVGFVSFAHLDADLYSSTYCALTWLTPLLQTGSLLLFDEFLGSNQSERGAFLDWSTKTGIKTILLAEFGRQPSGWGDTTDRRLVYQVVKDAELPDLPLNLKSKLKSYLKQLLGIEK